MYNLRRINTQPEQVRRTAELPPRWILSRWQRWWRAWWGRRGRERARTRPAAPVPTAAGFVFSNGTHILAGYQQAPTKQMLSGFGGKAEARDRSLFETAWRETVEELFDIPSDRVPPIPLALFRNEPFPLQTGGGAGGYVEFPYSFEQLECILTYLREQNLESPCYSEFPTTVHDLILRRRPQPTSEIGHLSLLLLSSSPSRIDPFFTESIRAVSEYHTKNKQNPLYNHIK
jgi:hypothetical protein